MHCCLIDAKLGQISGRSFKSFTRCGGFVIRFILAKKVCFYQIINLHTKDKRIANPLERGRRMKIVLLITYH